jgi:hypothetical protein
MADDGAIEERRNRELQLIKDACTRLSEHFSTVQIFVTKDPQEVGDHAGETESHRWGVGNYFARYGQVRDYVDEMIAKTQEGATDE